MRISLPKHLFSKIIRAVVEFDLISDGDKILIGISGGKDSTFLAYALAALRKCIKKKFTVAALTIDPKYTADFDVSDITDFCQQLDIEHAIETVDINSIVKDSNNKWNPCFTCAYFRRAAINRYANSIGANKVAYAHHLDDAVETFFMSMLSSGQLNTFMPSTYLDRTKITVIRPLVYVREQEIIKFVNSAKLKIVKSPCPIDGTTNRQNVKELIANLEPKFPALFSHLAACIRKNAVGDLWNAPKTFDELKNVYHSYIIDKHN